MNDALWTVVVDQVAFARAMQLARGCYQRALLRGDENLSGSGLRGKAARYAGRYKASAQNLLDRMSRAGVVWHEHRGPHGKRVLVIGSRAHDTARRLGATRVELNVLPVREERGADAVAQLAQEGVL